MLGGTNLRPGISLAVMGGTMHTLPLYRLHRMQAFISELGAETYPLFLRLGAVRSVELHPVVARSLLAEVEKFLPLIGGRRVPGILFYDAQGHGVGGLYGGVNDAVVAEDDNSRLSITAEGIRVMVRQFPPPVGFRSGPALESGWFECYFESLRFAEKEASGRRTPAMGGSGAPVPLGHLAPLPPATRWDFARTAGITVVRAAEFTETPAEEAYKDLLHAITAACNESLRLRRPLRVERDR